MYQNIERGNPLAMFFFEERLISTLENEIRGMLYRGSPVYLPGHLIRVNSYSRSSKWKIARMRPGVVHRHGFNSMSVDRLEDNDRCGPV